jgi:hypothetical protein
VHEIRLTAAHDVACQCRTQLVEVAEAVGDHHAAPRRRRDVLGQRRRTRWPQSIEQPRHIAHHASASARLKAPRAVARDHRRADRITARVHHRRQSNRQPPCLHPLAGITDGKVH